MKRTRNALRKRATLRALVELHLRTLGFGEGAWSWVDASAELVIFVNGRQRRLQFKVGMPVCHFMRDMGRITGWVDMLGLQPKSDAKPRFNGAGLAHAAEPFALHA